MTIEETRVNIMQGTQKHIVDSARRLFSEYSYLGVSMNDIAKRLNITKAALYYHFTSKTDIYRKVLDEVFDDLRSTITQALNEATVDKQLHRLIRNYLDFGIREKNLIRALMLKLSPADSPITKYISQLRERIANLIQPVIEEALASKEPTKEVDGGLLTFLLTSMMDGLLLEYSFLNKKINSASVSNQIIAVVF